MKWSEVLNIAHLLNRRPHSLSGGEATKSGDRPGVTHQPQAVVDG